MKKYILSSLAVVLAIVCFSFTRPKTKQHSLEYVYLVYTSTSYNSGDVANENNYVEDPSYNPEYDCTDGLNEIPCAIGTSSVYLTGFYPARRPNTAYINMSAAHTVPGFYYPIPAYGSAAFDTYNAMIPE